MYCKFPDKTCSNRYRSENEKKRGLHCRVVEWKAKKGKCPYDNSIISISGEKRKSFIKKQKRLDDIDQMRLS